MKKSYFLFALLLISLTPYAQKKKDQPPVSTNISNPPDSLMPKDGQKKFKDFITDKAIEKKG